MATRKLVARLCSTGIPYTLEAMLGRVPLDPDFDVDLLLRRME
jgi:hypothetical protein